MVVYKIIGQRSSTLVSVTVFSLSAISPAYHGPFIILPLSLVFYILGRGRTIKLEVSQKAHVDWIYFFSFLDFAKAAAFYLQ